MNIASIDIGSNTVLLLIAEINPPSTEIITLHNEYKAPRLGQGLKKDGNIPDESIQKLMSVLSSYRKLIDKYNCQTIICTSTNAMRIAANANLIINQVKESLNIDIQVITGDREAELSYLGAATVLPSVKEKVVMDVGGGSTEVIYGRDTEIIYKKSFPIGAVNLTEEFIHSNLPVEKEVQQLQENIDKTFTEISQIIHPNTPLIAVAGTPTSLSAINLKLTEYDDGKVEGSELTLTEIDNFIKEFSTQTPEEILYKYGEIISGREDVILAGTIILKTVAKLTGSNKIFVSGRGIRYGSVIEFINLSNR